MWDEAFSKGFIMSYCNDPSKCFSQASIGQELCQGLWVGDRPSVWESDFFFPHVTGSDIILTQLDSVGSQGNVNPVLAAEAPSDGGSCNFKGNAESLLD